MWNSRSREIYLEVGRPFRISFLFEGDTTQEFGIDNLYVVDSYGYYGEEEDDYLDERDWGEYEGTGGCGGCCFCSIGNNSKPDATLGIMLIGAFLLILLRRNGNEHE